MDAKLNTAIDEINQFVSERISVLLNDLIEESNEYAETKKQILQIPFVKKIINNIIYNTINNEGESKREQNDDVSESMTEENENIFLNIHENEGGSEELDNIVELDVEEDEDQEDRCVCCGGNRDMVNEKCLTCLEDCGEDNHCGEDNQCGEDNHHEEERQSDEDQVEEVNNIVELIEEESDAEEDVAKENEAVVEAKFVEEATVLEESESEVEDPDNEDEEVFEIEINGVNYFTTNEKSGIIYASDENSDPGDEVGIFQNGTPIFHA